MESESCGGLCGAPLTDLSKVLHGQYGFTYEVFNVMKTYLSERTHSTKMNDS